MSRPPPIGLLLGRPDSRAAQALRWGLRGLRAILQAAADDTPDDPGAEDLRGLLAALDSLLETTVTFSVPTLPVDSPSEPHHVEVVPATGLRLLPLARAVAADARFREMLRGSPIRENDDDTIWNDIQRLLLRVSPELAEEWRQRCLNQAAQIGARPDDAPTAELALGRDELIYPGLTGTVEATGLRSSTSAPLDPRVIAPADADLRFLAGVVSTYLWFSDRDPNLHHCLQSVFRFGLRPLAGEQQERYQAELLRCWQRVQAGAPGQESGDRLRDLLNLDEALHSLVYQPPAGERSWWGRLRVQARDALLRARDRAAQEGCQVHLQLLGGTFADINRLAPDSLQVDFGIPGEVAACLRVWARIDGEELKGRVLYRPPREEP